MTNFEPNTQDTVDGNPYFYSSDINSQPENKKQSFLNLHFEDKTSIDDSKNPLKSKSKNYLLWFINFNIKNGFRQLNNSFYPFATLIGVSGVILGLITAFRNLFANIFQGTFGRLSDKYGRKLFLIIGFSILTITTTILIFFANSVTLLIISIFQAFAISMIIPVWNATLGDIAPKDKRATFIGKIIAISAIIDLIISFILTILFLLADLNVQIFGVTFAISERNQYHISFIIAIANTLAAILFILLLKEVRVKKNKNEIKVAKDEITDTTSSLKDIIHDKSFIKFLVINSLFGLVMAYSWPADPIALITILKMNYWQIILYMNLLSAIMSLIFYFGGKLSDKIGRRKPFLVTGRIVIAFYCLLLFLAIWINCWWLIFFDLIISSIGWGLINSSIIAYIIDLSPEKKKGFYLGLFNTCWGIFCFIGSFSGGLIIDFLLKRFNYSVMGLLIYGSGFLLRILFSVFFFFIDEMPKKAIE
ncbi:MAG: MFS transporter [Asgard group archaeon]|nr:MFS transporter [Asgard group archaeon]